MGTNAHEKGGLDKVLSEGGRGVRFVGFASGVCIAAGGGGRRLWVTCAVVAAGNGMCGLSLLFVGWGSLGGEDCRCD